MKLKLVVMAVSGKAGIKKIKIEGSKSVPGSVDALASIPCGWVS